MEERGEEWICPPCKKEAKKRQREELESSSKKQEEENLKRQKQNAGTLSNERPTKQSKPQDPSRNADIRNYMVVESKDTTPSHQVIVFFRKDFILFNKIRNDKKISLEWRVQNQFIQQQ